MSAQTSSVVPGETVDSKTIIAPDLITRPKFSLIFLSEVMSGFLSADMGVGAVTIK